VIDDRKARKGAAHKTVIFDDLVYKREPGIHSIPYRQSCLAGLHKLRIQILKDGGRPLTPIGVKVGLPLAFGHLVVTRCRVTPQVMIENSAALGIPDIF